MGILLSDLQSCFLKHNVATQICEEYYNIQYDVSKSRINNLSETAITCGYNANINRCCKTYNYSVVRYQSAKISVFQTNDDAISGSFSGCYMASFFFNNQRYVAHIANECGANTPSVRAWNELVNNRIITNVHLYKPVFGNIEPKHTGIWGLITSDDIGWCIYINEIADSSQRLMRRVFTRVPNGKPDCLKLTQIECGKI